MIRVRRAGYVTGPPPSGHVSIADHADHLAALLDTLHIERTHIVVHSSSANMALQLAADRPERSALVASSWSSQPEPATRGLRMTQSVNP